MSWSLLHSFLAKSKLLSSVLVLQRIRLAFVVPPICKLKQDKETCPALCPVTHPANFSGISASELLCITRHLQQVIFTNVHTEILC